jgi:hypothetical protein
MIVSQSSAQPTASCSSGTDTGIKRIVTSKGLRYRRRPAKISAGSEAPPHEGKSNLKENIACYWLLLCRDYEYWPVIALFSTTDTDYFRRVARYSVATLGGFAKAALKRSLLTTSRLSLQVEWLLEKNMVALCYSLIGSSLFRTAPAYGGKPHPNSRKGR